MTAASAPLALEEFGLRAVVGGREVANLHHAPVEGGGVPAAFGPHQVRCREPEGAVDHPHAHSPFSPIEVQDDKSCRGNGTTSFAKAQELLKLAMMATRSGGVTLGESVEEFGCVNRSTQRMTVAPEATFPQTRADHGGDRRRRWRIAAKHIAPLLTPTAEEMAALGTAIDGLDAAGMRAEALQVRGVRQKVRALAPPAGRQKAGCR